MQTEAIAGAEPAIPYLPSDRVKTALRRADEALCLLETLKSALESETGNISLAAVVTQCVAIEERVSDAAEALDVMCTHFSKLRFDDVRTEVQANV